MGNGGNERRQRFSKTGGRLEGGTVLVLDAVAEEEGEMPLLGSVDEPLFAGEAIERVFDEIPRGHGGSLQDQVRAGVNDFAPRSPQTRDLL